MGRRDEQPFNQRTDTGRLAYRHEHEAADGRPLLVYTEPFWESPEQEALWLRAVRSCPLSEYGALDVFAYLGEVGQVAVGLGGQVKRMPRARQGKWERERQLAKLRGQMPRGTEVL